MRWEIVARWTMRDGQTWIVPASEGRHYRPTRAAALLLAWRRNRRERAEQARHGHLPPFHWIVRPAKETPPCA